MKMLSKKQCDELLAHVAAHGTESELSAFRAMLTTGCRRQDLGHRARY